MSPRAAGAIGVAVCSFGCSWAARKPHHDVIAAVDAAAPHGVLRSGGIEVLQSEVGPLGAFGGQQRANDRFARVGFVIVDLVDHGPIVVHNAAGQPGHFSVPPRARAEQSRHAEPNSSGQSWPTATGFSIGSGWC